MILQTQNHSVSIQWVSYFIIYSRGTACNSCAVMSLVSVLGSEGDCPLVECLMLVEPSSRLSTIRVFSSSGQETTFINFYSMTQSTFLCVFHVVVL